MRRKWLRAVSILLIISLLLSDNSLYGTELRVYATEDTNLIEDNENTAPSDDNGSENKENEEPDDPENEGADGNGGSGSGNGGNTGGSGDNGGSDNENGGSSGDSGSGNGGSGSSGDSGSGNGGSGDNGGSDGGNDEDGDGPDADPADPSDPDDPDAAKEDEILEDAALMEGKLLGANGGIMLLEDGEESKPADSKSLKDVSTQAEYEEYYTTEYIYYLATAEDFILLQNLCAKYDFEGIRFQIGNTGTEKEWDISTIEGFEGFGSEDHPFRGTMSCYYTSGSLTFKLDKPLFAYLGEGAKVYQFDFACEEGTPAAIAQHIVGSGEDADPVEIHDVNITGVIKSSGGNAGTIAGEIGENAKVVIQNVDSKVSTITGENAGTIAGTIGKNAEITIDDVKSGVSDIKGTYAGGIAGIAGDGVTITQSGNAWSTANVTGSTAAGGCFGMLQGSHKWNVSDNTLGNTFTVKGNGAKGQFAGILEKDDEQSGTLTIESNDSSVTVNAQIDGSGSGGGGIVGICKTDTTLVCEKPLTVTGTVKNSGTQAGGLVGWIGAANENVSIKLKEYTGEAKVSGQAAGGIFGKIEHSFTLVSTKGDDQEIPIAVKGSISGTFSGGFAGCIARADVRIPKMTVASSITGTQAGGIVGLIKGGKCIISDASVTGGSITGNSTASGGIVGEVQNDTAANKVSALALDGEITVGIKPSGGSCGSIVGKQSECLIYLTGAEEAGNEQLALSGGSGDLEEIGFKEGSSYGGVFRNQKDGDTLLIGGDGSLNDVGKVNGYAVNGSSGTWTLKGTAGMESLAIALNTQGNFGMEAFGSTPPNSSGVSDLLSASYTLEGDADISYDKTGIITINRNDKEAGDNYIFKGSLTGAASGTKITQKISAKQPRTGIFSTLGGTASFSGLAIDGEVSNASGTGGIAYQSVGDGITLTDIVMNKKFSGNSGMLGGIMARENMDGSRFTVTASNVTLASEIDAGSVSDFSGFITSMNNAEVELEGIKLGGSLKSTAGDTGGFLGKGWYWMKGNMKDITVQSGTSMNVSGRAGGLLYVIEGASGEYVTFENVKLANLSMTAGAGSAFLAVNGQKLAANIVDYSCAGATVTPGGNFDEVVYVTKADPYTGIISLHNSTKNFPDYHYENQATYTQNAPSGNSQAVYYYDIFQKIKDDGTFVGSGNKITGHVLDTPEKMLIWSAVHNATNYGGQVKDVFKKCFDGGDFGDEAYTLKGTLDLRTVSFYPAPNVSGAKFTGTDSAKVIFHAADMNDTAGDGDCTIVGSSDVSWQFPNNNSNSQHYRLHGGLLLNPTGGVTATGLTLEGTVANLGTDSGALIGGTLSGGGMFENITLNNLWIDKYNKENEAYGLLIAKIAAGTGAQTDTVKVSFNGIVMDGYGDKKNTGTGKKAAAALIGTAGGADVTNLELLFRNMRIADNADNCVEGAKHNGDVLAYASLIHSYDYTSNADLNKGSGRYLFSEDESRDKVTWGRELDSLTEYWVYDGEDPHVKLEDSGKVPEVIQNAAAGYYKPYVYKTEQIEVNPKPGDILKGCGTYEDPYIIEQANQFLTLYRYLSMKEGEKTDFFNNWKVNKLGSDSSLCNEKGSTHANQYEFKSTDNFPNNTQRELSRAYYQLGADINLSGITSGNYKIIADSFVGFGTDEVPFTGVWYGKEADDSVYTITLPSKTNTQIYDTYGFLQYAKGAVVKDMKICTPTASGNTDRTTIKASGAAGGVIGCILGGDNIIDNVTVDVDFVLSQTDVKVTLAAAGGYVGRVKKGGLILRNVSADKVSNFTIYNAAGTEITKATESTYKAYYGGALCGRVEDGYVIYEGSGDTEHQLWNLNENNTAGHGNLPLTPDYDIVNGAYLDAQLSGSGTVTVSGLDDSNKITVTLPNAAALQVMSMAMNADALNMMPDGTKPDCGYTEKARSRKADYDHIGNCGTNTESAPDDYKAAVTYDNVMTYPYLHRYFGITGNYGTYIIDHYGILNASGKIGSNVYYTTWKLASNGTYDMTEFGQAFRGIGALYDAENKNCGTFRGNFDGNGSTVTIKLDGLARNYTDTAIFPATLRRRGLFNTIIGYSDASLHNTYEFTISNLKLKGSVQAVDADSKEIIKVLAVDAGGMAGRIDNAKVKLAGIEVTEGFLINAGNLGYKTENFSFGGLVGTVKGNQDITVSNCAVKGGTGSAVVSLSGSGFAGGMIGLCNLSSINTLTIEQTGNGATVTGTEVISKSENAGGVVGHVLGGKLTVKGTEENPLTVENSTVSGYWQAAGIVGETRKDVLLTAENIKVLESKLTSYKCTGGVIGEYGAYKTGSGSTIKNIEVIDVTVIERSTSGATLSSNPFDSENGQGGIVGKCSGYLTLETVSVGTLSTEDMNVCTIQSVDNVRVNSSGRENGVGGLAGCVASGATLTLNGCTVKEAVISAGKGNATTTSMDYPASAGGVVGYSIGTITLAGDVTAENLEISTFADAATGSKHFAAGGIVGCLRGNLTAASSGEYPDNLYAVNNTVTGMYAGGVAGYAAKTVRLSGKGEQKLVEGGTVSGGLAAGGLFGEYSNSSGSYLALNPENGTNAIVVYDVDISAMDAGGVAGVLKASDAVRMEKVSVENCTVIGKIPSGSSGMISGGSSVGGIVGELSVAQNKSAKLYNAVLSGNTIVYEAVSAALNAKECSTNSDSHIAIGGLFGNVKKRESSKPDGTIFVDEVILSDNNKVGVRKTPEILEKIKLVKKNGSSYELSDLEKPSTAADKNNQKAVKELAETYGSFVGTLIGTLSSENVTIDMMHVSTQADTDAVPVMSQDNPPVVDVGTWGSQGVYSCRQNCHILYGAEESAKAKQNIAHMNQSVTDSNNLYNNLTLYQTLLAYYRLTSVGDWNDAATAQSAEDLWKDVYPFKVMYDGAEKELPILVCKPGIRSLNETITALSDIMTNVSGLSASNVDILTVEATPKVWEVANTDELNYNGIATPNVDGSPARAHISVTKTTDKGYTFAYLSNADGSSTELFDRYDTATGTLTYTELTYIYEWSDSGGRKHTRTFVLPVFVEEPLLVGVQTAIQAGRVTSVEAIGTERQESVVMANDSDYTLLLEYSFGDARASYDMTMPKEIWRTQQENPLPFADGTRLLLIDVTGGNRAYYYTVDNTTPERIPFELFEDSNGTAYKDKKLNRSDFEGTEQYLLQVLLPESVKASAENTKYDIHAGIREPAPEVLAKMQGELEKKIEVDSIPGIRITLDKSGGETVVSGTLSANGELIFDMQFSVKGEQAYWQKKGTIDSANNGKYLDLSCYLMNEAGTERVTLPVGTNFQYRLAGGNYSDLQIIPDQSGVYYYKGIREAYGEAGSEFLIRDIDEDGKIIGVTKDTTVSLQMKLKLPAELSGLTDSRYTVCIDLLRTDDPDYPAGYEDALGEYRRQLGADVVPDIGFAVHVDEADWEKLGINTYEGLDDVHEIPFKVMLDFREILRYASGDTIVDQWSDKDYHIAFEILSKSNAAQMTYGEDPFTDSGSLTDAGGNPVEIMKISMNGGDSTWKWDGNSFVPVAGGSSAESSNGRLDMKYRFEKAQIENTADKVGARTPIVLTGKVIVNGQLLKQLGTKEQFEKYLTNYRMKASLRIKDRSDTPPDGDATTYDYFVYTVTRLKTDM